MISRSHIVVRLDKIYFFEKLNSFNINYQMKMLLQFANDREWSQMRPILTSPLTECSYFYLSSYFQSDLLV